MTAKKRVSQQSERVNYPGYYDFFDEIKSCIQSAQIAASTALNAHAIKLYWEVGRRLQAKSEEADWGDGAFGLISKDLKRVFPSSKGFSLTNLYHMRLLAKTYDNGLPAQIANLPWGHNIRLLYRVETNDERLWYARKAIELGWSRSVLEFHIDNKLYAREGKAITNFENTLPAPQSDLAQQVTRDPYCFDFLTLREEFVEKELEAGLSEHVRKMLLALGNGFAYLGNQVPITVDGKDHFIDMLFYHVHLHCYVVVELKATDFKPEYGGKLNFYISAVDDLIRRPEDNPTLGLLLCKDKGGHATVKYTLKGMTQPIGVSSYTTNILDDLPDDLEANLPSREELAARLDREFLDGPEDETAQEEQSADQGQETSTS